MSLKEQISTHAARGNVKEAFKNEAGAIDLASIMVGIIVIGLIGGVIAATVFAVIPWAQDNAAKQQLDTIASAQSAYIGLSTEDGKPASFGGARITYDSTLLNYGVSGTSRNIVGNDTVVSQSLFSAPSAKLATAFYGVGSDAHYVAAVKSATGKTFYITDMKTQPTLRGVGTTPEFAISTINLVNNL
jgi:type II secretory pathway pseudopilin PulG